MLKLKPFQAALCAIGLGSALCGMGPMASASAATATVASASAGVLKVPAGQTVQITQTTALSKLVLGEGASVSAPDGYSVTLTVDGVGRAQEARSYSGNVVLTLTEAIPLNFSIGPFSYDYLLRTGLYFQDGALVPAKSVVAIVKAGSVSGGNVDGLVLTSLEPQFNGVMLGGTGTHVLTDPKIRLVGNGGNDFVGFGAAIRAVDNTNVQVLRGKIVTQGPIRPAIFAGDNAVVNVRNSRIEAQSGTVPADFDPTVIMPGKMYAVPWVLGLTGNNRATLATGRSVVSYDRSHIKAQAWGALSTDAVTQVKLSARHSTVEVVESGYGAYADGNSLDEFHATTFNVADMAAILSSGVASARFLNGSVVNSGRFGVMSHGNSGGTLRIANSRFTTQAAIYQAKSSTTRFEVDNATLQPGNGLLLQAVVNDDPNGGGMGSTPSGSNITAVFANSVLSGDVVNGNTLTGQVDVTLRNTQLTGAITTAATVHATDANGNAPSASTPELYALIGEFIHTYATTGQPVSVKLDGRSTWVVDKTSYLTRLRLADGATLRAPEGKTLTLSVNGAVQPIRAGKSYSGTLVLSVQ